MNVALALAGSVVLALLLTLALHSWRRGRRHDRHALKIHQLLVLADQLEADLRHCRSGLLQAHAVMSSNPDLPDAGEAHARQAIDAGLRALLGQRIWIRDRAAQASVEELDRAAAAMTATRDRLEPLLRELGAAQGELDRAMQAQIRREPPAG